IFPRSCRTTPTANGRPPRWRWVLSPNIPTESISLLNCSSTTANRTNGISPAAGSSGVPVQLFRHDPCPLRRLRSVGMNAERLRPQDKAFSRLGGDLAPFQKQADARDDSGGFGQHRVRFLSRNERPVIAIGAVGEGLLPCDQSS